MTDPISLTLHVSSVEQAASGEKNGRPWAIYNVVGKTDTGESVWLKTWEAKWKDAINQTRMLQYQEKTSARGYKDKWIVEDRKPRGRGGFPVGQLMDVLSRLESKVDMLCDAVRDLGAKS